MPLANQKPGQTGAFQLQIATHTLHIRVTGTTATFRHCPVDILGRILDVTGFAMHAVLGIDLHARVAAIIIGHDFVNPCRAIALLRRIIQSQVCLDGDAGILQFKMDRLIFSMVGIGDKDRRQFVISKHTVRLGIIDLLALGSLFQLVVI